MSKCIGFYIGEGPTKRPDIDSSLKRPEVGGSLKSLLKERVQKPSNRAHRADGLTESEGEVMDALVSAWNKFCGLNRQHPDELRDFADGMHKCQDLLAVRIARREYPEGWPIK